MALVMFDYDGVIVDSLEVFMVHFQQACRENGFQVKEAKDVIALFDGNVYVSMMACGLSETTVDSILRRYEFLQNQQLAEIEPFRGIRETLKRIALRHDVYVITSNLSDPTIKILEQNGIDCFKDVVGAEKEKSKTKKIQETMAIYPGTTAYYVGDTKGDMLEGKQAGTLTVGVTWGWHSSQKLQEGSPDFLFDRPEQLGDFFESINNNK